jgi:hypothetical protein
MLVFPQLSDKSKGMEMPRMVTAALALCLERPGLEVDVSKLAKIGEYATYRAGMLLNHRPDGSFTNW